MLDSHKQESITFSYNVACEKPLSLAQAFYFQALWTGLGRDHCFALPPSLTLLKTAGLIESSQFFMELWQQSAAAAHAVAQDWCKRDELFHDPCDVYCTKITETANKKGWAGQYGNHFHSLALTRGLICRQALKDFIMPLCLSDLGKGIEHAITFCIKTLTQYTYLLV